MKILFFFLLFSGMAYCQELAPDGTYVVGEPVLAPDGTYVGGGVVLAPDGTYVGDD